tara:strand:- start:459 stop:713 length:255 start_codon:yes stop_codon:yes gene_type:complete
MHIELDLDDLQEAVELFLKDKGLKIAFPTLVEIDEKNDRILVSLETKTRSEIISETISKNSRLDLDRSSDRTALKEDLLRGLTQ